jgi:P-type Ca2+ transporter type 2C
MRSVLTAVQLLWVNLIMDTFAALALATDPPTEKILNRPPQGKKAPLITTNMWKMIVGQAIFQLAVTFTLYFAGPSIFPSYSNIELRTVVFNTFVWMQIFNEFNNRRLDNRFNIFEGLHRNKFFIVINVLMVGLQVAIIFVGGRVFSVSSEGLTGPQWAVSVVLALLCMPWAVAVRLFPDAWFARVAHVVGGPVAVAYRVLGRFFGSIGRVLFRKKNKKGEKADEEEAAAAASSSGQQQHQKQQQHQGPDGNGEEREPQQMSQRTDSDPVGSPVVVVSDTDGSNNNKKNITAAPEIMIEDPEGRKGN